MDWKDYYDKAWKKGLWAGLILGVLTIAVNELSYWLSILPTEWAQIAGIVLPLGKIEFYLPVIVYTIMGVTLGWLYDNRKDINNSKFYQKNPLATLALMLVLVIPMVGIVGNGLGLWCAGCGIGTLEITVKSTNGGLPIPNGAAGCYMYSYLYAGQIDKTGTTNSQGIVRFTNIEAGETYSFNCWCTANPNEDIDFTHSILPGVTVSRTVSINCGGCVGTNPTHHWQCYQGDIWYYNECNNRENMKENCAVTCISDPPVCSGSTYHCNHDGVCQSNTCATPTSDNCGEDSSCEDCAASCVHQCTTTQIGTCVGDKICQLVWDSNVGGQCRKLLSSNTCGQLQDECDEAGVCEGQQKCVFNSAQNRNILTASAECICSNDCTSSGGCVGQYRCKNADIDDCLDLVYDANCPVSTTSTTLPSECTTQQLNTCIGDRMCKLVNGARLWVWSEACLTTTTTTIIQNPCNYNGVCQAAIGETLANCPSDCAPTTCNQNGVCESTENQATCPIDCRCDNDRICEAQQGENSATCPNDCVTYVCGNGICEAGEPSNCIDCTVTKPWYETYSLHIIGGLAAIVIAFAIKSKGAGG